MEKEIKVVIFSKTKDERDVMCHTSNNSFGMKISFITRNYKGSRPQVGERWVVEVLQQPDKKVNFVVPICRFSNLTFEDFKKIQNIFSPDFSVKLDVWRGKFVVRDRRGYVDVPGIAGEFDYDGSWDERMYREFSISEMLEIHRECLPFRRKKEDGIPRLTKKYGIGYSDAYIFVKGDKMFSLILEPINTHRSNDYHDFLVNFGAIVEASPEIEDEWDMHIFETPELEELCRRATAEENEWKAVRQEVGLENAEEAYRKFAQVNADEGEWHSRDIESFLEQLKNKPEENKEIFCDWTKVKINPAQEEKFWLVLRRLMILDYVSWEYLQYEGEPITEDISKLAEMSEDKFKEEVLTLSPALFNFGREDIRYKFLDTIIEDEAEIMDILR